MFFDRLLSRNFFLQLTILFVLLAVLLVGVYAALFFLDGDQWTDYCNRNDLNKWLLPFYLLIDSNALNNLYIGDDVDGEVKAIHSWKLLISTATFLLGAFIFNGFIIGIITNSLERRVRNHQEGHIHYLKSGHYIIMGYDDKSLPELVA